MKTKTILFALMLIFGLAVAKAQTPSGSSAGQSATPPDPQAVPNNSGNSGNSGSNSMVPQTNSALQARIEDGIRNEPTLGNSHVAIVVTDSDIDLSGTVGSSKDKQTAERIASSFDGNRKVNDKLVVTGHGHSDLAPDHSAMNNGGTGNAPNPALNPGASNPNSTPPRM